jgi:hypothetical protein
MIVFRRASRELDVWEDWKGSWHVTAVESLAWALCGEGFIRWRAKKIGQAFSPWVSFVAITWGVAPGWYRVRLQRTVGDQLLSRCGESIVFLIERSGKLNDDSLYLCGLEVMAFR